MSVEPIGSSIGGIAGMPSKAVQQQPPATGFGKMLSKLVSDVNEAQLKADAAVRALDETSTDSLHEVMLAMSKAELSFKFLMQTRNKLVDAYNEIMRMQV